MRNLNDKRIQNIGKYCIKNHNILIVVTTENIMSIKNNNMKNLTKQDFYAIYIDIILQKTIYKQLYSGDETNGRY